jgi:hypothetical protein
MQLTAAAVTPPAEHAARRPAGEADAAAADADVRLKSVSTMNGSNEIKAYYGLLEDELLRRRRVIDTLIDSKQKYTKGILCEDMIRRLLRQIFPGEIAVAQGFVRHGDIKSRQCDILIYNSARYAPFLSVNDLVVLPIEAVIGIIEVKTLLNQHALGQALEAFRDIDAISSSAQSHNRIMKYILAFDSIDMKTIIRSNHLNPFPPHLDGITILGKGFIRRKQKPSNDAVGYMSTESLFVMVYEILSRFYLYTRFSSGAKNPYDYYARYITGDEIETDK